VPRQLPPGWDGDLPAFTPGQGPLATRVASGQALNALASRLPELMGGSADLAPSTHTIMDGAGNFEANSRAGRNMHFRIREHAMGAILNGMALHRGLIPYGATFFLFTDYMRPPMRLAAMNGLPVIYVFTHDSIGLGEDGPTHQPVEQLLGLRSVPVLFVIRPADANEAVAAWRVAVGRRGCGNTASRSRTRASGLGLCYNAKRAKGGALMRVGNMFCMGGRVIGPALAWELVRRCSCASARPTGCCSGGTLPWGPRADCPDNCFCRAWQ
jgi:transketolase